MKLLIAALAMAATLAGGSVCAAQTPTEATRWLIPLQAEPANAPTSMRVGIYNMGAEPAHVSALAFRNGRVLTAPAPVDRVLQPGRSLDADMSGAYDYVVVVADRPVMASGALVRLTTATEGQSGQIRGAISNSGAGAVISGGNGDVDAYMRPFNYYFRQSVAALPIACAGAPARHFACSMNFSGTSSTSAGSDVRVRPPIERGQAPQTPGRTQ